jgi:hypothetical protein
LRIIWKEIEKVLLGLGFNAADFPDYDEFWRMENEIKTLNYYFRIMIFVLDELQFIVMSLSSG